MKLENLKQNEALDFTDELISAQFDDEISEGEKIQFEIKLLSSEVLKQYYNDNIYTIFKISNSIYKTKIRAKEYAEMLVENILNDYKFKKSILFFDIYSVFLEHINKILSR